MLNMIDYNQPQNFLDTLIDIADGTLNMAEDTIIAIGNTIKNIIGL
jgi:hypothetical protein